jgi:hypothetical protein
MSGVRNMSEALPLMLTTVDTIRCLLRPKEPLSWLPLSVAAEAVVQIAKLELSVDGANCHGQESQNCYSVYQLVNRSHTPV